MNDTAATILAQLSPQGSRGLKIMLGATLPGDTPNSVTLRFKGSRTLNHAEISLNGRDTYDMTLGRTGPDGPDGPDGKYSKVSHHPDLYAEDLRPAFERATGLTTAIPRIISAAR